MDVNLNIYELFYQAIIGVRYSLQGSRIDRFSDKLQHAASEFSSAISVRQREKKQEVGKLRKPTLPRVGQSS